MKAKLFTSIMLLFVLFISGVSFAQMGGGGANPQERLKKSLEDYKTKLSLTDEQYTKVETILTEQMNEMIKLRENAGGDREAMRAAITESREKADKKIEELLTDEQKVIFKKMIEERAQRGMNRPQR